MAANFDVEETLAKLTMNQKIKMLCGKVSPATTIHRDAINPNKCVSGMVAYRACSRSWRRFYAHERWYISLVYALASVSDGPR